MMDPDADPPLLPEYARLFSEWQTPDDLRAFVRSGNPVHFTTSEHADLRWTAEAQNDRVQVRAQARPVYKLVDLLVTSWWNTVGRDIPAPPADPARAMHMAMTELLAACQAHPDVTIHLDPDAEDGVDLALQLIFDFEPGLGWDEFLGRMDVLTDMDMVAHYRSFDAEAATAVLRAHGLLVFMCEDCGQVVSDRVPGWPCGVWVSTDETSGATCGSRTSTNATVADIPVPHVGRLIGPT